MHSFSNHSMLVMKPISEFTCTPFYPFKGQMDLCAKAELCDISYFRNYMRSFGLYRRLTTQISSSGRWTFLFFLWKLWNRKVPLHYPAHAALPICTRLFHRKVLFTFRLFFSSLAIYWDLCCRIWTAKVSSSTLWIYSALTAIFLNMRNAQTQLI